MAPLKDGDERKNLQISSQDDINVEIWIAPGAGSVANPSPVAAAPQQLNATIDLKGDDVRARIVRVSILLLVSFCSRFVVFIRKQHSQVEYRRHKRRCLS